MLQSIKWDGQPISRPGIYSGVPIDVYHSQAICAGPSVSSTGLRRVLEENGGSPADFYDQWSGNPNAEEDEEKAHFVLGRAMHHLVLGEARFANKFVIQPETYIDKKKPDAAPKKWTYAADECKSWRNAVPKGRTIITATMVEQVKGMAMSLGQHPLVRAGILRGKIERTIILRDKETGLFIKVRPDAIPTDSGDFCDLKTTTSVQYADLMFAITDFAYHQQAALCPRACREVLGIEFSSFNFLFVQKKRPFSVRRVQIKPDDLKLGERQNTKALRLIAHCMKTKRWPGPGGDDDAGGYIDLTDHYRNRANESLPPE